MDSRYTERDRDRRGSYDHGRSNRDDRRRSRDAVPDLYSIHQGKVAKVQDYGAFIEIKGFSCQGLVHKSQLSRHFTENVSDVVEEGDFVWVKVVEVREEGGRTKIGLSMKHVGQGRGEDLDPNNVKMSQENRRNASDGSWERAPIDISSALQNTVCPKCGVRGHLATECFNAEKAGDQKNYELLPEVDDLDWAADAGEGEGKKRKRKKKDKDKDRDRDKERRRDRESEREQDKERDRRRDREGERGRSRSPSRSAREKDIGDALEVMRRHSHKDKDKDKDKHKHKRHRRSPSPTTNASHRDKEGRRK
ncbi:uncharacterized protein VTP21DRAFT_2790 [Calcarisporiella thermophila]|uniref:uncharacterized protein n=1 Tax=Calcarisporiella thermophila TaxID=911321 RepID=UPI003743071E